MARIPPSRSKVQRVSEVLAKSDSRLGQLLRQAGALGQLEQCLAGLFSAELAMHFQVAAVRKNRLILVSPTASWATRLRMQAPQIIAALQRSGYAEIEHIDIRVAPLVEAATRERRKKPLSPAAQQALAAMARLRADSEDNDRN